MDYAIALYMNDEKTALVHGLIETLAPECGSDYCLGIVPHVTVSAIVSDDEEAVKEAAGKLSKKLTRGEIKLASIGVFNPLVLFLAPVVDAYLTESCQIANDTMLKVSEIGNKGRYIPNFWVPHMAVAMKMDQEGLYRGFKKLSEIFVPFCAEIDKMALIKWEENNPYQELAVYNLDQRSKRDLRGKR